MTKESSHTRQDDAPEVPVTVRDTGDAETIGGATAVTGYRGPAPGTGNAPHGSVHISDTGDATAIGPGVTVRQPGNAAAGGACGSLGVRCGDGGGRAHTARSASGPGVAAGADRPLLIRPAGYQAAVGLPPCGELGEDRLQLGARNRFAAGALHADDGREPHRRGHGRFNGLWAVWVTHAPDRS
ncbi:hypothetical protein GCM10010425_50050 [Streptomyces spororaveus]|uniref:Uncharacterized protein n=1 Tax=Streptomyces spororaveus TaxID=284039 RepID=A0ABQ3T2J3_9ACTN|nr:hypothetical protein Sspor_01600 [Streptomyces spororaveus]